MDNLPKELNAFSSFLQEPIEEYLSLRHACKKFDSTKKISKENFDFILRMANLAPTSFGMEPWKILVVQDKAKRQELLDNSVWGAVGQLPTCSHFIIILSGKSEIVSPGSEYTNYIMKEVRKLPEDMLKIYTEKYKNFFENEYMLNSDEKKWEWSNRQAYIVLAYILTVSAALGIDSCAIEGFSIDAVEKVLEKSYNVDTRKYGPAVMVALGYRAEDPLFPKTRRPLDKVVEWF